jgi:hypothetical protein
MAAQVSLWRLATGGRHNAQPTREAIAALAYLKFLQRAGAGASPGDSLRDWLEAERELKSVSVDAPAATNPSLR